MNNNNIKTSNKNGLCYKQLDGYKIGDVFSYVSERGILRHYVVSFLHKRIGHSIATIIFPDGYSETHTTENLRMNNDNFIENLENWSLIYDKYKEEAQMYL